MLVDICLMSATPDVPNPPPTHTHTCMLVAWLYDYTWLYSWIHHTYAALYSVEVNIRSFDGSETMPSQNFYIGISSNTMYQSSITI